MEVKKATTYIFTAVALGMEELLRQGIGPSQDLCLHTKTQTYIHVSSRIQTSAATATGFYQFQRS
jgi:hypothetical protein